jgi:hypothetical protein
MALACETPSPLVAILVLVELAIGPSYRQIGGAVSDRSPSSDVPRRSPAGRLTSTSSVDDPIEIMARRPGHGFSHAVDFHDNSILVRHALTPA